MNTDAAKMGTMLKYIAARPKKIPARLKIAVILNSLPPSACVLSQTKSLERVQGVLMPINQLRLAFSIKTPVK